MKASMLDHRIHVDVPVRIDKCCMDLVIEIKFLILHARAGNVCAF